MNKILIVDDNEKTRTMLKRHLKKEKYEILEAKDGFEALKIVETDKPGVILLDVMMPKISGMDVCRRIRARHDSDLFHIIMLTGVATAESKVSGLDMGADDYVTKPFDIVELLARIRVGFRSVANRKQAIIDNLTQVYNRNFFTAYLKKAIEQAHRYNYDLSLILTDIDHFKKVNDTHGHLAGDKILTEMGSLLKKFCRASDLAVRWGGEEFIIVMPETNIAGGTVLAEKIRAGIAAHDFPVVSGITASFGVATLKKEGADRLLKDADEALYTAKENGRNQVVTYSEEG